MKPVDPSYYDRAYFNDGTKSHYAPYGPGSWAGWIVEMVSEFLEPRPTTMLDVGCAYGYLVSGFNRAGIDTWGFDISRYAVAEQGRAPSRMWVGDAADPDAWINVDLALATELAEHLTPEQAERMLLNGFVFANRMLLLVAVDLGEYDAATDGDGSHIHVVPMAWWEEAAQGVGWTVADASRFNEDRRSREMGWAGRWLYLVKHAEATGSAPRDG